MTVDFAELSQSGKEIGKISVPINYDIIDLFSNGLYKSPNKAVEELVTNSYDADARRVHVLLPDAPGGKAAGTTPLWVIDDGHGMNTDGFHQLWRIAESNKKSTSPRGRKPIGQFGIGKLAAYVLAQKLTHISKSQNNLCLTTMDFGSITGRYNDDQRSEQKLSLREVDEPTAKRHLADIRQRDPDAWNLMFGRKSGASTWTAAALSNFKELYRRLSSGSLRWVLRTGLPLHTNFQLFLDGDPITSSKESIPEIARVDIDESISPVGQVKGCAVIYKNQLTTGKSQKTGRSHGFFIRVRERVINLEDELFGIEQPNHAAWSRFAMNISADGLRDHLLSSREGVRDSDDIRQFREFLVRIFNKCRAAYDDWNRKNNEKLDIADLLSRNPSPQIVDPLFRGVHNSVQAGAESFYIGPLKDVEGNDRDRWLDTYREKISTKPFENLLFDHRGRYFPALTYEPNTRVLVVNIDHPFVDKLTSGGKNRDSAMLFASSEVLLEGQLSEQGIARDVIASFLEDRDRVLRLTAGAGEPTTAADVLNKLKLATENAEDMERAVGYLFHALGFRYVRKGGHRPGVDGVLYARLGMQRGSSMDYKVVYDTKTTNETSVSSNKIDVSALESHRVTEGAEYGFLQQSRTTPKRTMTEQSTRKCAIIPELA